MREVRLYLSSYQLGAHPEWLVRLVRGDRRGWVVANALDGLDENRRRNETKRQLEALAALGLQGCRSRPPRARPGKHPHSVR